MAVSKLFCLIAFFSYLLILSSSHARSSPGFTEHSVHPKQEVEIGEEGMLERVLMEYEKTDYSEVGANPEHDPKPPGKI